MGRPVVHWQIDAKDPAQSQRFYADLFDWNFDTNNPGGYGIAPSSENGIATGVGDATPAGSPGWVTFYVAVSSVDDALAKAEKLGGKVIVPKFSPGPNAVLGMFADPEGHVIGVTEL